MAPAGAASNIKVEPQATKSPEEPVANTKQSTSNSNTSTSSKYKEPPRHSSLIKKVVQNASKPVVKLSDAKIDQLKRVVNESGGTVRTEVGQTGSVKGIKHSQVEGYGPSTAHKHIIHLNQN